MRFNAKSFTLTMILGLCAPLGTSRADDADGLAPPITRSDGVAAARSDLSVAADHAATDLEQGAAAARQDMKDAGADVRTSVSDARTDFDHGIAAESSASLAASGHMDRARTDWSAAEAEGRKSRGLFRDAGRALVRFFKDLGGGVGHGVKSGVDAGKAGVEVAKAGGDELAGAADVTVGTVEAGTDIAVGGTKAAIATTNAGVDLGVGVARASGDLAVGAGKALVAVTDSSPSPAPTTGLVQRVAGSGQ